MKIIYLEIYFETRYDMISENEIAILVSRFLLGGVPPSNVCLCIPVRDY